MSKKQQIQAYLDRAHPWEHYVNDRWTEERGWVVTSHSRGKLWNVERSLRLRIHFERQGRADELEQRYQLQVEFSGDGRMLFGARFVEYVAPEKPVRVSKKLEGYEPESQMFDGFRVGFIAHVHKHGCGCEEVKVHEKVVLEEEFDSPEEMAECLFEDIWMGPTRATHGSDKDAVCREMVTQLGACLA